MKEKKKIFVPLMPEARFGVPFQFVPIDPEGSYTGVPEDAMEQPVQDADDL